MNRFHFWVNDRLVEVRDEPPVTTLLDFLRRRLRLTGTKEGCAEGDCGACTVAFLDPHARGGPRYRAINSCLVLLPMMRGRRVYTVEGLSVDGRLHPAQQALVDHFGSQCGFCTPGVVMSMFEATYREDLDAGHALDDQMSGNLCRCTGYRPIREAAAEVAGTRPKDRFLRMLEEASEKVDPRDEGDRGFAYVTSAGSFLEPRSFEALYEVLSKNPGARVVSGGTDVGLLVTKGSRRDNYRISDAAASASDFVARRSRSSGYATLLAPHSRGASAPSDLGSYLFANPEARESIPCLVSLEALPGIKRIEETKKSLVFGAALPLTDLEQAASSHLPPVARMLRYFAARQIKHRATIGGNLCTASPIGDLAPVLLALDATCILRRAGGRREVPVSKLFLDYRKTAVLEGEILEAVEVPLIPDDARAASYKVSKRRELDISSVSAAFFARVNSEGDVFEARLAYGGMAATPSRARQAEAALLGRPWTTETIELAASALEKDFKPIDDLRASAWYRRTVAANLLRGFFMETGEERLPLLSERPSGTVEPRAQGRRG